ncbi:MAG: hypothetical protein ACP5TL_02120 [Candidatus Micrarchaeia archaeon]
MFNFVGYSEKLPKYSTTRYCVYCGTKNVVASTAMICTNCEAMSKSMHKTLADANYENLLMSISKSNSNLDYEKSLQYYEQLIQKTKDPMLLYAEALTYIAYSNYEMSKVSYDRPGFMEENSVHTNNALQLMSKAKLLLAKASSDLEKEFDMNKTDINAYNLFIVRMKLGDVAAANAALDLLKEMKNEMLYNYAIMKFYNERMKYDKVLELAEKLIKGKWNPHLVLYYVAYALLKKGKKKDARKILLNIKGFVKTENLDYLEMAAKG